MNNPQFLLLKHQLSNINSGHTTIAMLSEQTTVNNLIIAQEIHDPKILDQMQKAWGKFVDSGQIWALIIGLFVGYMFKSLTSY